MKNCKQLVVNQTYNDYCVDCPFYTEKLVSNKIYCDNTLKHTTYEIVCTNKNLCEKLIEYLKSQ